MIKSLHIQNYAIIDKMDIDLSKGLNIITGETGAGKSILLGATGLILGNRADTKAQLESGVKTIVEAVFQLSKPDLEAFFLDNELDFEDETIVRREISPTGKSRAFINDTPVSLRTLQSLSNQLVDLHQQFDTLELQEEKFQLNAIDALAGHQSLLDNYKKDFQKYRTLREQLKAKKETEAEARKEKDFLQFQLNELQELNIQSGEQESLESEHALLEHGEKMIEVIQFATQLLDESDQPMITGLKGIIHQMNQAQSGVSLFEELASHLQNITIDLEEWNRSAQRLGDQLESNPARLTEVDERLNAIYQMERKHQVRTDKELLEIARSIEEKLNSITFLADEIEEIHLQIQTLEVKLEAQSEKLSKNRKKVAQKFEKEVIHLLSELHMTNAQIKVDFESSDRFLSTGKDVVQFLFTANKGGTLSRIKKVASGGELSRLSLCIKSVVAGKMDLPTLIFDEIDAGISGEVAHKMGMIIQNLASRHQIIMITHSPQIASKAQLHLFVKKKESGTKTLAEIEELNDETRIIEIAKMLSGDPPSPSAIQNAKELVLS
jgi:DNA repair protein RecN (Recombination protein N)